MLVISFSQCEIKLTSHFESNFENNQKCSNWRRNSNIENRDFIERPRRFQPATDRGASYKKVKCKAQLIQYAQIHYFWENEPNLKTIENIFNWPKLLLVISFSRCRIKFTSYFKSNLENNQKCSNWRTNLNIENRDFIGRQRRLKSATNRGASYKNISRKAQSTPYAPTKNTLILRKRS